MAEHSDLLEILAHVDPRRLDYAEWLSVGMALKEAGHTASDWDGWSRADADRYHAGECFKKWDGFHGANTPVKSGTIVQLARAQGWTPSQTTGGHEIGWEDAIGGKDDLVVIDKAWVEAQEVAEPGDWNPVDHLVRYLETLFEASENVGYVTESWEKEGRFLPTKGNWDRTAGELIEQLNRCDGDIGAVLGDSRPEAGAWIRFNPLDGKGCKNENVTEYRYALVESDEMEIDQQNAILRELELPIACLVHSGRKSLHAIVKVEASGYEEYRKRVDYLYDVCRKNGLKLDAQNRNPSRLSRMPGILRNGHKQYLLDTHIGKESWKEWQEWIESVNDDLPEPENMAGVWDNLPALSPPLIHGVLRQGHKMLLAGPSKAGKSYALIELCCAIAEGMRWLTWQCAQGRVLYVNLELDRASCLHRFRDVYQALGWPPAHLENIDIWNLRGKSVPMDKLAPKLIRRAVKKNYLAIVIDPIYKVITGDENSADQMAHFCNQFDRVCAELGAAVIYCHHHSKGQQGQKRSMDRASGSGVFARDPDALLDLIELDIPESLAKQQVNNAVCACVCAFLATKTPDWEEHVSQDERCSEKGLLEACERFLDGEQIEEIRAAAAAGRELADHQTAWRIEGTLREFPKFAPVNLWFDYPVHHLDEIGSLGDIKAEGFIPAQKDKKDRAKERRETLENAYAALSINGDVTVMAIVEYSGKTENTIKRYIDEHPNFERNNGKVVRT